MKAEHTEVLLLDEHHECTSFELMQLSGMTEAELSELIECGVLTPAGEGTFSASCIVTARTASRLRRDLELDADAVALVLKLLDRISELESNLQDMQAKTTRWTRR